VRRLNPEVGALRVVNYLRSLAMEVTMLARACGKSDVHHLEPEDLVALTCLPLTQKSPVFSCESVPKNLVAVIHFSSECPYAPPEWLPWPPPPT
jgi:hypothetical protein